MKEQDNRNTDEKERDQQDEQRKGAQKQDHPHKKHGLPPKEEDEEKRFGGLDAENFKKNLGCGG